MEKPPTRAIVVGAYGAAGEGGPLHPQRLRSPERRLEEAVGLTEAIGVDVIAAECFALGAIRPATYIGSGQLDLLKQTVAERGIELVIVDAPLRPSQQRNLERALDAKVLDRTGLILEIFGERAKTREGSLQVEFAHLTYQRSRLVRSWTHLERQRGGLGFVGGPGETQIEADRRMLQERLSRIARELETVRRTRGLHRSRRKRTDTPVVALVGYTNAGKSTLFNRLSGADVLARDLLFATLDPTARQIALPDGKAVILSDTVGFISDLPTTLVAAFRATLEEVVEADLILHVRDAFDPDHDIQADDVGQVLSQLGIDVATDTRILEVWNKIDRLADKARSALAADVGRNGDAVAVSALTGEGVETLLSLIEKRLARDEMAAHIVLPADQGAALNWLYETGRVVTRDDRQDGSVEVDVRIAKDRLQTFRKRFPDIATEGPAGGAGGRRT